MKKCFLNLLLILVLSIGLLLGYPNSAHAFVASPGTFTADSSCPAFSSIRKQTNPGNITLTPDAKYRLLGKNKSDATYYQIKLEGTSPSDRWVAVSCGQIDTSNSIIGDSTGDNDQPVEFLKKYVLAASWQPAFCETKRNKKDECKTLNPDRFDATSFSIHGLWPQDRDKEKMYYCNVPDAIQKLDQDKDTYKDSKERWMRLPALQLSPELREDLAVKMPGYESYLHRHEWYKHGTCYSETPEEYYQETILLLDQLNASEVRDLFAQNLEEIVTNDRIDQAFEIAFGVTDRVAVSCSNVGGEKLITELKIKLKGDINLDTDITDLLAAANTSYAGCSKGQVDSAYD